VCIVKKIQFKQECSGYLKQAADANTPEIALQRIDKALAYIEANDLTDGYTSVLWRTEDENIGFWYENIKACKKELEGCLNSTQLEKTNVLMKVRESLTDSGEKGTTLTIPSGIHKYPNNTLWAILLWVSILAMIADIIWMMWISEDEYSWM
jgi:hypothetical protein